MKKQLSIKFPILFQLVIVFILTIILSILIYLTFNVTNDTKQKTDVRYKIISNIMTSEFNNLIYNLNTAIKTGRIGENINFLIDYLDISYINNDADNSANQLNSNQKDLFSENNISLDNNFPLVICNNQCYIFNHYQEIRENGKIVDVKYAINLKHLSSSIAQKIGIYGFYVVAAPNIENYLDQKIENIPYSKNMKIHEFTNTPTNRIIMRDNDETKNLHDTINDFSDIFDNSLYKLFSIKIFNTENPNLVLLLPTTNFLANTDFAFIIIDNKYKVLFSIVCLLLISLILRHLYRGIIFQTNIIKSTNKEIPTFYIKDELALLTLTTIDITRSNKYLNNQVKKQEALIDKYTMFDCITTFPLRDLFCQDVTNRIKTSSINDGVSAMTIIRIDYKYISSRADNSKEIIKDISYSIKRTIREQDLIGVDEDYKFLIYYDNAKNIQEILNSLRQIKNNISLRYENIIKKDDHFINIGICTKAIDLSTSQMYHNAELALYNAIKNYNDEPVIFSEQINCSSLDELSFADEFEQALVRNKVHGQYLPHISVEDGNCLSLDVSPFWITNDGSIINEEGIYQKLTDVKRLFNLSYFIIEQALGTLRRLDLQKIPCHFISFTLNRVQMLDPKLFEFLERMTLKYKILPSRIVFTIKGNYLGQEDISFAERLIQLKEADYMLALRDITSHGYCGKHMKNIHFDIMKFSSEILQFALKEEANGRMLRSLVEVSQSNHQITQIYGINNSNEDKFVKNKILPDTVSGDFYIVPIDEIGILTALQNFSLKNIKGLTK